MSHFAKFFLLYALACSAVAQTSNDTSVASQAVVSASPSTAKDSPSVLSQIELTEYVKGYALSYDGGQFGTCTLGFKSSGSLTFYCDGPRYYETGEWTVVPESSGVNPTICRKMRRMGEACQTVVKDGDKYYLGELNNKPRQILKRVAL